MLEKIRITDNLEGDVWGVLYEGPWWGAYDALVTYYGADPVSAPEILAAIEAITDKIAAGEYYGDLEAFLNITVTTC